MSCANGNCVTSEAPPEVADQPVVALQLAEPVERQYTVLAAGKVIPLFPLQSPNRVPDAGAAAPAIVMSWKSASVAVTAAQVSVLVVPVALERTKMRHVESVPAERVKVPLIVWLPANVNVGMAEVDRPALVKLLNVLAPETMMDVFETLVKLTS